METYVTAIDAELADAPALSARADDHGAVVRIQPTGVAEVEFEVLAEDQPEAEVKMLEAHAELRAAASLRPLRPARAFLWPKPSH
jgi:hypothetical protein